MFTSNIKWCWYFHFNSLHSHHVSIIDGRELKCTEIGQPSNFLQGVEGLVADTHAHTNVRTHKWTRKYIRHNLLGGGGGGGTGNLLKKKLKGNKMEKIMFKFLIGVDEHEAQQFIGGVLGCGHFHPHPQQFISHPTI
jgi:hypothetical protein